MQSTITKEQETAIAEFLKDKHIPSGLGDRHEACSIAAINLALTGTLTDSIPDCMSPVIGKWVIAIQDSMPDKLRNSIEWRTLLPLAAGTGRGKEAERLALILDWMWTTVLPTLQSQADRQGFGPKWKSMTDNKTTRAAVAVARTAAVAVARTADATAAAAARAADAADAAAAYDAAYDAAAAYAAAAAARAAYAYAADAAADAADAAAVYDAATAAADAATAAAAARAAYAAAAAAYAAARATYAAAARATFWDTVNPAGLLKNLIEVN